MNPTQIQIFADMLQQFKETLIGVQDKMYPWVFAIFGLLLLLELGRTCTGIVTGENRYAALLSYFIRLGLLCFVIPRWEYLYTTLLAFAVQFGLTSVGNVLTSANFLNPAAYIQRGDEMGAFLYAQWQTSSWVSITDIAISPLIALGLLIAWIVFFTAFVVMGLTLFAVQLEAAFAMPALLVLLPFLALKTTAWIGQGAVTFTVRIAFQFLILAIISSVVYPFTKGFAAASELDLRQIVLLLSWAIGLALLFVFGPKLARNIFSGAFSLGAGSASQVGMLVSYSMATTHVLAYQTARLGWNSAAGIVQGSSQGRINPPRIPPLSPSRTRLLQSLSNGARHLD